MVTYPPYSPEKHPNLDSSPQPPSLPLPHQPEAAHLGELYDDADWTSRAGAGAQQPDHVRVADLLQKVVLREKVLKFGRGTGRFQHLHSHRTAAWRGERIEKGEAAEPISH